MEFFIKKGATLPLLKLNIVDNGRSDYNNFLNTLELSSLFFSMTNVENGTPKITNKPAGVGGEYPNYFIYYQFQNTDTTKEGRFEGEFVIKNEYGNNVLTLGEKLYVNITESFILDDLDYVSCYIVDYACCSNPIPVPLPQPSSTPTPTPTVTDSQLSLTLQGFINPGSVVIDYVLTSNRLFSQELTMSFSNLLGVIVGSPVLITTGVTLSVGEFTGTTQVILPDDFQNLNRESLFFGNTINLTGLTYTTYYQNSVFFATPTPTPTPTPTETIVCECFEIVAPLANGSYSYIDCSGIEQPVVELGIGESSRVCVGNSKINAFDGAEFYVVGLCSDCLLPTPTPTPTQTEGEIFMGNIIENINLNETFTTNEEELNRILRERPKKLNIDLPFKDGVINVNLTRRNIYENDFRISNEFGETLYSKLGEHYEGIIVGSQNSTVSLSITSEGFSGSLQDEGLVVDINNISGFTHHCQEVFEETKHDCNTYNIDFPELDNYISPNQEMFNNFEGEIMANINFENLNSYVTMVANKNVRYLLEVDYDIYQYFGNDLQATTNYITALFNSISAIHAAEGVSITMSEIKFWTSGESPYRTYGHTIPCTANTSNLDCALKNYRQYYKNNNLTFNGDVRMLLTVGWPNPVGGSARYSSAYTPGVCSPDFYNCLFHQLRPTTVSPGSPPPEGYVDGGSNLSVYYGNANGWNVIAGAHEIGHTHGCSHTFSSVWNCNYTIGSTNVAGTCCLDCCSGLANCACVGGTTIQNPTNGTCIASGATIMSYNTRQPIFGPQPQQKMVNTINAALCLQNFTTPTPTPTPTRTSTTPTPTPTRNTPTPTKTSNWDCAASFNINIPNTTSVTISGVTFVKSVSQVMSTQSFAIIPSSCIGSSNISGVNILTSLTDTSGNYTMSSSTLLTSIALSFGALQATDVITFSANNGTTFVGICQGCCGQNGAANQIVGTTLCSQLGNVDGGAFRVIVNSTEPFNQLNVKISSPLNNGWGKFLKINNFRTLGTSITPTKTPTRTATPTVTKTANFVDVTPTSTPTVTLTKTLTSTPTRTLTPTRTSTQTPTVSKTSNLIVESPTSTPTRTLTPTPTRTLTPTKSTNITLTLTPTRTKTPTPTKSSNTSLTPTPTRTKTPTPTKSSNTSLTPTPTRTKTPTPSTSISISLCDILSVANTTGIIYKYDYVSNTVTELPVSGRQVLPSDIAVSENYLFTISSNTIRRFQITRNPWTATNPTDFIYPSGTFATSNNGLFALSDSTLISFNTLNQIISVNLTNLTTTVLFSLPAGRSIAGDIIYTTNNRYIIVNRSISTSTTFVSQFDSSGNPMGEMSMASITLVNGSLFIYNSELYIQRQSTPPHNYKLTFPSTISPVLSTATVTSLGFAQPQNCISFDFPVSPTPTKTVTPTKIL